MGCKLEIPGKSTGNSVPSKGGSVAVRVGGGAKLGYPKLGHLRRCRKRPPRNYELADTSGRVATRGS